MRPELLSYLACPSDGADLQITAQASSAEEIQEGSLQCSQCGAVWPVRAGIPRFVDVGAEPAAIVTGKAFAREWSDFSEIAPHHRRQFLDWIAPLTAEDFAGKTVLEGGCGKGRHSAAAHDFGAKAVVSVDIGDSIEVARDNNAKRSRCHFIQADLTRLPLRPVFDVAFSVGVLHHLEAPGRGAREMLERLRPKGLAVFWVYGRENNDWILRFVDPLRKAVTSHLPHALLKGVSALATIPLWAAVKTLYRLPRAESLPYGPYLRYISIFPFREIHSIVYDHLVAPTAHYLTRKESEALIHESGGVLRTVRHHNRQSWTVIGSKRAEGAAVSS